VKICHLRKEEDEDRRHFRRSAVADLAGDVNEWSRTLGVNVAQRDPEAREVGEWKVGGFAHPSGNIRVDPAQTLESGVTPGETKNCRNVKFAKVDPEALKLGRENSGEDLEQERPG
jgi:hypothetical protein